MLTAAECPQTADGLGLTAPSTPLHSRTAPPHRMPPPPLAPLLAMPRRRPSARCSWDAWRVARATSSQRPPNTSQSSTLNTPADENVRTVHSLPQPPRSRPRAARIRAGCTLSPPSPGNVGGERGGSPPHLNRGEGRASGRRRHQVSRRTSSAANQTSRPSGTNKNALQHSQSEVCGGRGGHAVACGSGRVQVPPPTRPPPPPANKDERERHGPQSAAGLLLSPQPRAQLRRSETVDRLVRR